MFRAAAKAIGIWRQIGFGQHHQRQRAAGAAHGQIALKPRGVEIIVAAGDYCQRVHIGCDQLMAAGFTGRPPADRGFALQHLANLPPVVIDPIADRIGAGKLAGYKRLRPIGSQCFKPVAVYIGYSGRHGGGLRGFLMRKMI